MNSITRFQGDYRFLSNFWPASVQLDGVIYPTVEHAYQAAKSLDPTYRQDILACQTPGQAKRRSSKVALREDWTAEVRTAVMEDLLRQKFQDPELKQMLLSTGDKKLIEGNVWHDQFWGICTCEKCEYRGENRLGKLLSKIRSELST